MSLFRPGQAAAIVEEARRKGMVEEARSAVPESRHPAPIQRIGTVKPRRATAMNQTEREYEAMLKRNYPECEVRWEALTLRLADRASYTPDFIVFFANGSIECHEVKGGFIWPKALVKPRIAAETFPWRFVLAQKRKGEWEITELAGKWKRGEAQ